MNLLTPLNNTDINDIRPITTYRGRDVGDISHYQCKFPILHLFLIRWPLFRAIYFLFIKQGFVRRDRRRTVNISQENGNIYSTPIIHPVRAFIQENQDYFARPDSGLSNGLFVSVPPRRPPCFSFTISKLFIPLLFHRIHVMTSYFANQARLQGISMVTTSGRVFSFR